jgi:carbon monoxide dehydrogenase subunit G
MPTDSNTDDRPHLDFSDTVSIDTDKETLWTFVSDAGNLADVVPGAQSVTQQSERRYAVELERGIGRVRVAIEGEVELVEMDEPDWVIAEGEGFDSTTGSTFELSAGMEMNERESGGTDLSYHAAVYYTGGIARVGAPMLKKLIRSDVERYFENVKDAVEVD